MAAATSRTVCFGALVETMDDLGWCNGTTVVLRIFGCFVWFCLGFLVGGTFGF